MHIRQLCNPPSRNPSYEPVCESDLKFNICMCTVGPRARQPVKFSLELDLQEEECQQLLLQNMPEHIQKTKITQRLFIK